MRAYSPCGQLYRTMWLYRPRAELVGESQWDYAQAHDPMLDLKLVFDRAARQGTRLS
jgi:hypothetical protein